MKETRHTRRGGMIVLAALALAVVVLLVLGGARSWESLLYREVSRSPIRGPGLPADAWLVRKERRFAFLDVPSPRIVIVDGNGVPIQDLGDFIRNGPPR